MTNIPEKPEPKPKWLVNRYEGAAQDIVDWYYRFYFHALWDGNEETIEVANHFAETSATAKLEALIQTGSLIPAFEDAVLLQLHDAQKTGWYKDTGEIHAVNELIELSLQKEIERDPDGGTRYELQNLLKILSALEQMGVDKSLILAVPHNISKAKESTRVIKHIMQGEAADEEKVDQIEDVLKDVADKNVTFDKFKDNAHKRMGKSGSKTVMAPLPANLYLLPGGKEFILIETDNSTQTRAIESALKGLINGLPPRDINDLMRRISDKAFTKGKSHFYQCRAPSLHEQARIVRASEGVILPTLEEFQTLANQALGPYGRFVNDLLVVYSTLTVPVAEIVHSFVKDVNALVATQFQYNGEVETALERVNEAIDNFYSPMSFEVKTLARGNPIHTRLMYDEDNGALILQLEVERP